MSALIILLDKMIKAIFLDCDGVLTTGSYFYSEKGKFLKEFSSIDGKGFSKAKQKEIHILVITEEPDEKGFAITKKRCEDQRIELAHATSPKDKLKIAKKYATNWKISLEECAYIADDIGDLFLFKEVGLPIAVFNACDELKDFAKKKGYITKRPGGNGAVREAIEWVLKNQKI